MKRIAVCQDEIYEGNLILVNARYPLRSHRSPILAAADQDFPKVLLRREIAEILQGVLRKISARKSIVPVSGYRSYEEQKELYEDSLRENGIEFTQKYVALPNHSEHQTGLAIDLGLNSDEIDFIRPDFPYDGICQTFRETAVHYGFIERYSAEKERLTGIAHEPWHFRYVGPPHSQIMAREELSLEEYTEYLKRYDRTHPLLFQAEGDAWAEIYFVPAVGPVTEFLIPENQPYQISGNNVDGFVVTWWRKVNE